MTREITLFFLTDLSEYLTPTKHSTSAFGVIGDCHIVVFIPDEPYSPVEDLFEYLDETAPPAKRARWDGIKLGVKIKTSCILNSSTCIFNFNFLFI